MSFHLLSLELIEWDVKHFQMEEAGTPHYWLAVTGLGSAIQTAAGERGSMISSSCERVLTY